MIYYTQPSCRGGGSGWTMEGNIGHADAHSTEHILNQRESDIKRILEAMTRKYKFNLIVHDLALKAERKKALFKFIGKMPVIVVNNRKFDNPPSDEESLLKLMAFGDEKEK